MDIESIVKREAPQDNMHDKAYAEALRGAFNVYKGMDTAELRQWQVVARKQYDSTHRATAACVVLYELIHEKNRQPNKSGHYIVDYNVI